MHEIEGHRLFCSCLFCNQNRVREQTRKRVRRVVVPAQQESLPAPNPITFADKIKRANQLYRKPMPYLTVKNNQFVPFDESHPLINLHPYFQA